MTDTGTAWNDLLSASVLAGPVPEERISDAESALGVRFPDQYRDFLARHGALVGDDGVTVYGLPASAPDGAPLWSSVVTMTQALRRWGQAGTDVPSFIPISDDGMGTYFFLDTAAAPYTEIHEIGMDVHSLVSRDLHDFIVGRSSGR